MATAGFVGADPVVHLSGLAAAVRSTAGDALYAGHLFRTLILERTQRGVDYQGAPFAPYSRRGPYYLYQNGPQNSGKGLGKSTGKKTKGGGGIRTPYGVRYESYAAAKESFGRTTVDLFGLIQHTHMLNTLLVKTGGMELGLGQVPGLNDQNEVAHSFELGFYGQEAERARGHNEGNHARSLPQRRFFDVSQAEITRVEEAMGQRMMARVELSLSK